jgi:hypothetical protein
MNDDQMREFMDYMRGKADRVRYCQRCEEPRPAAEFVPGPIGVCLHCLKSMRPGERAWLKADIKAKFGG